VAAARKFSTASRLGKVPVRSSERGAKRGVGGARDTGNRRNAASGKSSSIKFARRSLPGPRDGRIKVSQLHRNNAVEEAGNHDMLTTTPNCGEVGVDFH
jgi:hypothetical protein